MLTQWIALLVVLLALAAQQPAPPENPQTAREWRQAAAARHRQKDYDGAMQAYRKSLELEPDSPASMYGIGTIFALKHDTEQAFVWLTRARATRRWDMSALEATNDFDAIKHDARFAALLPAASDFTHPFVESVTILREWDGEAMNDQFGWIARNIGDVDRDGVPDVVTSAPTSSAAGNQAGRVYVYSTKSGKLLWKVDGNAEDQLGTGLEGAGDSNGDGIPDVIASAPGGGKAYVYSGADGRVLLTLTAEAAQDQFGRHASGVGDVDGDGRADIIVGAPGNSANGKGAGRAYVYSGKDGHVLLTLTGERAGDNFGSAVAGATTTRGHPLLIVGAPAAGRDRHGRVYVYDSLSGTPQFVIDADQTGSALGAMFLTVIGDVDADGTPDVYASDWSNTAKGPSTGRVYIHSGKDGHRLLTLTGETAGEGFGTSPSNAGDVDGDGHADLIVGAWQYAGAAVSGGRAYLYSGKDGHLLKTFTCRTPGDTFGFDSVSMGDIDHDGTMDFLITSAWSAVHRFHSGRMFIVSSGIRKR